MGHPSLNRFLIVTLLVCAMSALHAVGLSTPFADVKIEQVPLGKKFMVTHSAADGVSLMNLDDQPVKVRLTAAKPGPTELRDGALPIPSLDWVRIEPDAAVIPPHGQALFKVFLKVPNSKEFADRYYQVMIWTRGEVSRSQGIGLTAGLISRLRFRTEKGI